MLTALEEQLATAHGLAIAAEGMTAKVLERVEDPQLRHALHELGRDADEIRVRCLALERRYREEQATEVLHAVNAVKENVGALAVSWFRAGTGPLASWSFLTMSEAAEVTAWSTLTAFAVRAEDAELCDLSGWALEVQERHLRFALESAVVLARAIDPAMPGPG